MKTLPLCGSLSVWLLAGSLALFSLTNLSLAAGGGAGGSGGGAGGAGAAGGAGGGHGGGGGLGVGAIGAGGAHAGGFSGGSLGAGHVGSGSTGGFSNAGQHVSAGFSAGRAGGLVPTGFPSPQGPGVSYANGGGFARGTAAGYGAANRNSAYNVGGGQNVGRGFGRTYQNVGTFDGGTLGAAANASRIRNAWTEPNNPHVNPAARASRSGYNNSAYDEDRSVLQGRLGTGQHLYPGAAGYSALNAGRTHAWQGTATTGRGLSRGYNRDFNRHTRDTYNQFFFTSAFFPYLYGSFFPAYNGYYDYGYLGGGFGDYVGGNDGSLNANYGTPNFNEATGPYVPTDGSQYTGTQDDPTPQSTPPTDDNTLPPNQPSSVGPQAPAASEERESNETGPDTLVESVQNELAKRGYYGGKVDSMYNEATRTALRRFQTDQHLAVTGRINEATLHALQLD